MVSHPSLWSAATLARVYSISLQQWLNEARTVWTRLEDDADFMLRAGVVGAYANATGVLGFFEEGFSALNRFESSLAPSERGLGEMIVELWRTAFAVWQGKPADVDAASLHIAPLLQSPATDALWTYNVAARHHRTQGARHAEAAALSHARQAAYASSLPFVKVLVLTDLVIHQWLWGEDSELPATLDELERTTTPPIYEGVRHFLACCRGAGRYEAIGFEKPKIRVFSYLIAAGCADDIENARWLTAAAVATADEAHSMFHQAIARVAAALVVEAPQALRLWDEAEALAAQTASDALLESVKKLRAGDQTDSMLSALWRRFVDRQMLSPISVRVFSLQLDKEGTPLAVQRRELELALALALHTGPLTRERLMEAIWPDQPAEHAQNSLKVYVNRLRHRLGHNSIVLTSMGYALAPTVMVDIDEAERILRAAHIHKTSLNRYQRATLLRASQADVEAIESAMSEWQWSAPHVARIESVARDACLTLSRLALESQEWREALNHANRLLSLDGGDLAARDVAVKARKGMGDMLGAARAMKQGS